MAASEFASQRWASTPSPNFCRTFAFPPPLPPPPPPPPPSLFFRSLLPTASGSAPSPDNAGLLPPSFIPPTFSPPPPFANLSISPTSLLSPATGFYPPAVSATFPPPPAPTYPLSSPSYSGSSYDQRSDSNSVSPISTSAPKLRCLLRKRSNISLKGRESMPSPKRSSPQANVPLDPDVEFVDIPASQLWLNRRDSEQVCFDRRNQLYCIYRAGMIEYPSGIEGAPNMFVYPPSV